MDEIRKWISDKVAVSNPRATCNYAVIDLTGLWDSPKKCMLLLLVYNTPCWVKTYEKRDWNYNGSGVSDAPHRRCSVQNVMENSLTSTQRCNISDFYACRIWRLSSRLTTARFTIFMHVVRFLLFNQVLVCMTIPLAMDIPPDFHMATHSHLVVEKGSSSALFPHCTQEMRLPGSWYSRFSQVRMALSLDLEVMWDP